ncbi:MAG: hypothetical protein GY842_13065 [bacterium]|nr:hypothetical protein [bacterium]
MKVKGTPCWVHDDANAEAVVANASKGAKAQRRAAVAAETPPPPPKELLKLARKPPRNVGDLLATVSLANCALIERRIGRSDFEAILGAVKFQAQLLRETGGEDRAQLLTLAGLTEEEGRDLSDEQLAVKAREAMGGIGPS